MNRSGLPGRYRCVALSVYQINWLLTLSVREHLGFREQGMGQMNLLIGPNTYSLILANRETISWEL